MESQPFSKRKRQERKKWCQAEAELTKLMSSNVSLANIQPCLALNDNFNFEVVFQLDKLWVFHILIMIEIGENLYVILIVI